ncbi:MAG: cytochrome c biogenesis protein ResB [Deltaproteobacteria bacterium]|nr:cytochrome c biogenesis protein ResB [Deltaproteobacteria bacterium]
MPFLLRWFSSLKLTVWVLTLLIAVFLLGAVLMPLFPEAHRGMNAAPLFAWWRRSGRAFFPQNGWLPLAIFLMAILTLNTLVCTVRSLRIGPSLFAHITHAGFLLILLAHLVSASTGFRESGIVLPKGHAVSVARLNLKLRLSRIDYVPYPNGMPKDYSAEVVLITKEGSVTRTLAPNAPAFYKGIPIYLKTFGFRPIPYAVCEVADDPGARVALAGSILFLIGALPLLGFRRIGRG